MAYPTVVNPQITDSVTQANVKVLGDAPAMAMANLFQSTAQALSTALVQGLTAQQAANTMWKAAAGQGVSLLYPVEPGHPVTDADVIDYLHGLIARHQGESPE